MNSGADLIKGLHMDWICEQIRVGLGLICRVPTINMAFESCFLPSATRPNFIPCQGEISIYIQPKKNKKEKRKKILILILILPYIMSLSNFKQNDSEFKV